MSHTTVQRQWVQSSAAAPAPKNDPALFTPTRCSVIKPFCVAGKRLEPGAIIDLPRHEAESLRATGKVEL